MDTLTRTEVGDTDTVESVHRSIQRTLERIDRTDLNDQEYRNLEAFQTAVDIFHRRISTVPDNNEIRERKIEAKIEEVSEEKPRQESTSSSRFSIKKAPTKGWEKVKEKLVVKLSSDKYAGCEDSEKTMETFVDDNEEPVETVQSLEGRFHEVVQQVVAEKKKPKVSNRFSIKSVSDVPDKTTTTGKINELVSEMVIKPVSSCG